MEIKPPSGGISPGGISRGADSVGGLERVREGTMQAFEVNHVYVGIFAII